MPNFQIPTAPSATKIRNFIVRTYSGRAWKRPNMSNPYADYQVLEAYIPSAQMPALVTALREQGWTEEQMLNKWTRFQFGDAQIEVHPRGSVTIMGTKRAKRSTLPYYD